MQTGVGTAKVIDVLGAMIVNLEGMVVELQAENKQLKERAEALDAKASKKGKEQNSG